MHVTAIFLFLVVLINLELCRMLYPDKTEQFSEKVHHRVYSYSLLGSYHPFKIIGICKALQPRWETSSRVFAHWINSHLQYFSVAHCYWKSD